MAGTTRLELATSCVTGMRSNQLSYAPIPIYIVFNLDSTSLLLAEASISADKSIILDEFFFAIGEARKMFFSPHLKLFYN